MRHSAPHASRVGSLWQYWRQHPHCSRHDFYLQGSWSQNFPITVEEAWPICGQFHAFSAPALHAGSAKLAAPHEPRQQSEYSEFAEFFDEDHVERAVVNSRTRSQSHSSAIGR